MASSPQISALALNALVLAVESINDAADIALAAAEMAIGSPSSVRSLDLCFGNCQVESQVAANLLKPIIIGRGVARAQAAQFPLQVITPMQIEQAFSSSDILGGTNVDDAYAFGSVFLVTYQITGANPPTQNTGLLINTVRGGGSQTGAPLLIKRDCGLDAAIAMSNSGVLPTPLVPWTGSEAAGTNFAIEILRFILDIESYVETNQSQTSINAIVNDLRRPRGWGGFASENMAGTVTAPTAFTYDAISAAYTSADASLYNLLSEWVGLSCWTPDFLTFWSGNQVYMGTALKAYLLNRLNIVL